MALYTSYYTKQLALRPESAQAFDVQVEGERTLHKAVARRAIDLAAPYINWCEVRDGWRAGGGLVRQALLPAKQRVGASANTGLPAWLASKAIRHLRQMGPRAVSPGPLKCPPWLHTVGLLNLPPTSRPASAFLRAEAHLCAQPSGHARALAHRCLRAGPAAALCLRPPAGHELCSQVCTAGA